MRITVESGVTDCACCGMPVMVSDLGDTSYCDGCEDGTCDGTLCDENGEHTA